MTIEENKALCEKYPFLTLKVDDCDNPIEPDYEFTWLDSMPDGWRKAFGLQMCEELKAALIEDNMLEDYEIVQIKEKYGGLRWYDNGHSEKVGDIIEKYEELSERTCIDCGEPAKYMSLGWICPYCTSCAELSFIRRLQDSDRYDNIRFKNYFREIK